MIERLKKMDLKYYIVLNDYEELKEQIRDAKA